MIPRRLLNGFSTTLQSRILEKIESLRAIENDIPTPVILHNINDSTVFYMSPSGLNSLGVTLEKLIDMGVEYYSYFFNPEDAKDYVPKILGLLERNNDDEIITYFQQVRQSPRHDWFWYLSATRIFVRDEEGKPLLTITTATPVDEQHHITTKAQRLLDENNFLRHNNKLFNQLTSREKDILRLIALGCSSSEIAEKLHISDATANTHRRNIKRKLMIKSNYDVTRFAHAFDLI